MTEPPRPGEGAGSPPDPTSPPPSSSYSVPGEAASPDTAPPPAPQYETPPASGAPAGPPGAAPGGGYGQPPGGYPPGGGYPPPGGYGATPGGYGFPGTPPPGYSTTDEKNWALIAHFGGPVGVLVGGGLLGWVAPLVAMMAKGNQSPTVRAHAQAALNFQITWAIALVASVILAVITCGVLFFVPMIVGIVPVVFGIIAGVKANDGQLYAYPMSASIVK